MRPPVEPAAVPPEVRSALLQAIGLARDLLVDEGAGRGSPAGTIPFGDPLQDGRDAALGARPEPDGGLVARVAAALYAHWYMRRCSRSDGRSDREAEPYAPGRNLVEALRSAHADTARWDAGWSVVRVSTAGRVVAAKDGLRRLLDPIDYLNPERPGLPPRPGGSVVVPVRRDSTSTQPGYWITYGETWPHASTPPQLVRLYWNVEGGPAPRLVEELTGRLGELGLAYALKCPVTSRLYRRADAVVLFVPRASFAQIAPVLREAHAALERDLEPDLPPLVRRLAPGLGLAEDPSGEESFGGSRCRLIAEALVARRPDREGDERATLGAVCAHLHANGIPPDRPYLASLNSSEYVW